MSGHSAPQHCDAAQPEPGLRVLVIGQGDEGDICDAYRTGMFIAPLRRLGVDVRYSRTRVLDDGPVGAADYERRTAAEVDALEAEVATSDVLVFRRWYVSHILCNHCAYAALTAADAEAHARSTGHGLSIAPDLAVRRVFDRLERDPSPRDPAIVYETDDDLLRLDPSNAQNRIIAHEHDLIERMVRRADMVTVSTPVLATRLAERTSEVRVLRNAVDPDWYGEAAARVPAGVAGSPARARVCYYGSLGRLRDYAVCAQAVDAVARAGATRVWLGAPDLDAAVARVASQFDEIHPYVVGVPAFARRLADMRPDIGLAPLIDTPFARAKSELHWLEYTMAGAVTVASALAGRGPYDAMNHGVDGFLARSNADWRRTLDRLSGSPQLRAEVHARAAERVLAEYSVSVRAAEWADAYRHAATRAGVGLEGVNRTDGPRRRPTAMADRAIGGNRAARRRGARAVQTAGQAPLPVPPDRPIEPAPPPPRTILETYVAAQSLAGRSPLRIWLGQEAPRTATGRSSATGDGAWVTIDTTGEPDLRHDVLFGLPFGDGCVDAIEAPDVVDRLGVLAPLLIAEAARVLRPGGTFRVGAADRATALARHRILLSQGVDPVGAAGQLPVFSEGTLMGLLREAGLSDIQVEPPAGDRVVLVASR